MVEQVVEPRIRGFISVTAHPEGCAVNVRDQAALAAEALPGAGLGPTLVVGSSTGYGLATLLSAAFGYGAPVLGVCFEKPSEETRLGTAGWYNLAEAHRLAREQGRHVETINADAFAHSTKDAVIGALRERFGKLDLLIYSLASPRRVDPDSGETWSSVLKPIGAPYSGKAIDLRADAVTEATIEPATPEEIEATVRVMGGEDWALWIERLREADLLADGFRTVAYSYIGPRVTYPIYRSGTIGRAKEHLEATARDLDASLAGIGGRAWVSVNKAVVTQASAAIPAVSLYLSVLLKVMREQGSDEGPIEQIVRLFGEHIGPGENPVVDEAGLIRLDDRELAPAVQAVVDEIWDRVSTESLREVTGYDDYQREFRRLFGFDVDGVDYGAPTEVHRPLL